MNDVLTCLDVRRLAGAEPQTRDPAVAEHCRRCVSCAAFVRDMQGLDARIVRALQVEVPEGLEARIVLDASLRHAPRRWGAWLAVAASAILVLGLSVTAWRYQHPRDAALSQALVAHIENPDEVAAIAPGQPLLTDASLVEGVFKRVGVHMSDMPEGLSYAHVCLFRGELVAHLVMQGKDGPVTILLLPHIHVKRPTPLDEGGFHGVIEPVGQGSIAIVTNNDSPMQPVEQQFMGRLQWSI